MNAAAALVATSNFNTSVSFFRNSVFNRLHNNLLTITSDLDILNLVGPDSGGDDISLTRQHLAGVVGDHDHIVVGHTNELLVGVGTDPEARASLANSTKSTTPMSCAGTFFPALQVSSPPWHVDVESRLKAHSSGWL